MVTKLELAHELLLNNGAKQIDDNFELPINKLDDVLAIIKDYPQFKMTPDVGEKDIYSFQDVKGKKRMCTIKLSATIMTSNTKKKREKATVDTLVLALDVLEKQTKIKFKRTPKCICCKVDKTRFCEIWKRNDRVRVYFNSSVDSFKKLDKSLISDLTKNEHKNSKAFDVYFDVPQMNIAKVFEILVDIK